MHDLYLHHRNIYDGIIHQRIANLPLPLSLGSVVFLILTASRLLDKNCLLGRTFIKHFPPGRTLENYSALSFYSINTRAPLVLYNVLLGEFLTDPNRAGKYVLDGSKYALVARFLLDGFLQPCPKQAFFRQVDFWHKLSLEY